MTLPDAFLRIPIAHRALHGAGAPENSLAAVRAAVAAGYGIEIDVQPSSDGVAMVFHDYVLDRLTAESGPVEAQSAAELGAIRLDGTAEGIPTLAEVLQAVGGAVPLLIEIKDQDGAMGPEIGGLQAAVARALKGYDGPVAVMSFNPHAVAEMARLAPEIPRGLTTCGWDHGARRALPAQRRDELASIPDYDRVGACFISHNRHDLTRPRVAELKARGVPVISWTIRSEAEEAEARKLADNITFEGFAAAHPA
ncbi:MAG: phosphodiesterase [Rhodobacterales bacterium]|nr:MAG: phosphodiesterase [Rhodobacterales bacterium]